MCKYPFGAVKQGENTVFKIKCDGQISDAVMCLKKDGEDEIRIPLKFENAGGGHCFFGTESTLALEVRRLGAQNVQVSDGRVQFEGDAGLIAAANLNLRTAERVLLLLGRW